MPQYIFELIDNTSGAKPGTVPATPGDMPNPVPTTPAGGKTFGDGLEKRLAENAIERFAISPLNQATGGLASPLYQIGKGIVTGKGAAMIGAGVAGLAMAGIMLAVNALQERMAKMEADAEKANNNDNALIRAGSVSKATFYKASLAGVKKVDRR
jgi:hypothetical protein